MYDPVPMNVPVGTYFWDPYLRADSKGLSVVKYVQQCVQDPLGSPFLENLRTRTKGELKKRQREFWENDII